MPIIHQISEVVLPVLLCILAGYGLARFRLPYDTRMVSSLVANIGYPALVLSHLSAHHIALADFLQVALAATCALGGFAITGTAILKLLRLPLRAYLAPMMLNNVGNIGLPVAALAFGHEGLAYGLAFLIVVLVAIFTVGIWLPMGQVSLQALIRQPVIYAVALTLLLMATGATLPAAVAHAVGILGGLAIPLMLLTLGYSLASLNIAGLGRGTLLSVLHIMMAAGVAAILVEWFGLTGPARGVFIVECMMPVSVATYLWVDRFQPEHARDVAGLIMISTTMTVIVLPLVLAYWV